MISFKNVVSAALSTITKVKDQVIYHQPTEQFYVDIKTGSTIDRVPIKDSAAGKGLSFNSSTHTLSLQNENGDVIDSENLPLTFSGDFVVQNGHLYIDDD